MKFKSSKLVINMVLFTAVILFFSACKKDKVSSTTQQDISKPLISGAPAPEVPTILEVPAGNVLSRHLYAEGVQTYVCTETSLGVYAWVFKAPTAILYSSSGMKGKTGTHYAGPTWESNSGSWVKAVRLQGVTVSTSAIPWLLLGATSSDGPGIFDGTTYIQRVNTVGGLPPTTGANAGTLGQEVNVDYTAEYYFYVAE